MIRMEIAYRFSPREGQDDELFETFWENYECISTAFKEIILLFWLLFCAWNKLMFFKEPPLFPEINIAKTSFVYVTFW